MLEYSTNLAGESYLKKHGINALLVGVLESLASDMPDDPIKFMIERMNRSRLGQEHTIVCPNPWCGQSVSSDEFETHAKQCSSDRWTKCIRCDARVEVARMHQHRLNCHLVSCSSCGEFVFPRMLALCPLRLLKQAQNNRKHTGSPGHRRSPTSSPESSREVTKSPTHPRVIIMNSDTVGSVGSSYPMTPNTETPALKHLQELWRRRRARKAFTDVAFQGIWNLMETARESRVAMSSTSDPSTTPAASTVATCDHSSPILTGPTPTASSPTTDRVSSFSRKGSIDSNPTGSSGSLASPRDMEKSIAKEYTEAFRKDVMKMIEARDVIEYPIALKLINDATKILASRPVVVHMETPVDGEVVVVGDIHGQLKDLLHILSTQGIPGPKKMYVFNGDFVDRGPYGVEVLICIYLLLCSFPGSVQLNRGNHEDFKTNSEYGFHEEILSKYDDSAQEIIDTVTRSFKVMPLVTVIDKRVAVLHGGLPRHMVTLDRIALIGKIKDVPTVQQLDEDDEIYCDLVWSDPVDRYKSRQLGGRHQGQHWRTSARGCGIEYLEGHTEAFTALNHLDLIVRSHEMVKGGYEVCHQGRCVTVFSASDYCGVSGNRAAIAVFSQMRSDPVYHTWFIKQDVSDELDLESSFNHMTAASDHMDSFQCSETNISFDEQAIASGAISSTSKPVVAGSQIEADCIHQIMELIWVKRYDLLSHFCAVDVEQIGYVTKVEWCEVMKKVLHLQDLPWYFLSPYLAEIVIFREIPCVRYASFLAIIDSVCGKEFEDAWLRCTVKSVFRNLELPDDLKPATKEQERLAQRRRSSLSELPTSGGVPQQAADTATPLNRRTSSKSMIPPAPPGAPQRTPSSSKIRLAGVVNFISDRCESPAPTESPLLRSNPSGAALRSVNSAASMFSGRLAVDVHQQHTWQAFRFNFNYFVSILRAKSAAAAELEDSDFYVLFRFFDSDEDGHIVLGELVSMVKSSRGGGVGCVSSDDDDDDDLECSGSSSAIMTSPGSRQISAASPLGEGDAFTIDTSSANCNNVANWMYPTMLMLQRFFLFDKHRDLRVMFRFMDRDRDGVINLEDFKRAAQKMNRIISRPVEPAQIVVMFNTVCNFGETSKNVIDLETFLSYFRVNPLPRRSQGEQSVTTVALDHTTVGKSPPAAADPDTDSQQQPHLLGEPSASAVLHDTVKNPHRPSTGGDELEMDSGSDAGEEPLPPATDCRQ